MRARTNFSDRLEISVEVSLRVRRGQRGFAKHVEGIAIRSILFVDRTFERFLDRAPHDKLMAHDAHRLLHRRSYYGFAGATRELAQYLRGIPARCVVHLQQLPCQHQTPGRRVDEQRVALPEMVLPLRRRDLVRDQRVRRRPVRNAQQGLGDAHQQHTFLRRQVVLLQKRIDSAFVGGLLAHCPHQARCHTLDFLARGLPRIGGLSQLPDEGLFVSEVLVVDSRNRARLCGRLFFETHAMAPWCLLIYFAAFDN